MSSTSPPATCHLCGTPLIDTFPALPLAGQQEFAYLHCQRCGLAQLADADAARDLAQFYALEYEPVCADFAGGRRSLLAVLIEANFRRVARRIESLVPRGRMLDVGCGAGLFLATMRRRGWQTSGIEPNIELVDELRSRHGLDVHVGTLADAPPDWGPFDAVTMFHVIEHVPDPARELATVRKLLRPGGVLVVVTPNVAAAEHRVFGRYWYALQPPDHLWLFSRQSLQRLATDSGFTLERLVSSPVSYAWASFKRSRGFPPLNNTLDAVMKASLALPVATLAGLAKRPAELELYLKRPA